MLRLTSQSQLWQPTTIAELQPSSGVLISGARPVADGTGGAPTALDPRTRLATVVGVEQGRQTIYLLSDGTASAPAPACRWLGRLILIGRFLRSAADASYAQTALPEALQHLRARDVMTRDVVTVSGLRTGDSAGL